MENTSINKDCACPRKECERHGDCDACKSNHKSKESLAFCERPAEEDS